MYICMLIYLYIWLSMLAMWLYVLAIWRRLFSYIWLYIFGCMHGYKCGYLRRHGFGYSYIFCYVAIWLHGYLAVWFLETTLGPSWGHFGIIRPQQWCSRFGAVQFLLNWLVSLFSSPCFVVLTHFDEICTAPKREHDFRGSGRPCWSLLGAILELSWCKTGALVWAPCNFC